MNFTHHHKHVRTGAWCPSHTHTQCFFLLLGQFKKCLLRLSVLEAETSNFSLEGTLPTSIIRWFTGEISRVTEEFFVFLVYWPVAQTLSSQEHRMSLRSIYQILQCAWGRSVPKAGYDYKHPPLWHNILIMLRIISCNSPDNPMRETMKPTQGHTRQGTELERGLQLWVNLVRDGCSLWGRQNFGFYMIHL